MAPRPRPTTEEQRRLDAHAADTAAHPLTDTEVQRWLDMLRTLDDSTDPAQQLQMCRELLRHAPEDDMLDSDARIIKMAIEQLEEELSRAQPTSHIRRPRRVVLPDDDDDSDCLGATPRRRDILAGSGIEREDSDNVEDESLD